MADVKTGRETRTARPQAIVPASAPVAVTPVIAVTPEIAAAPVQAAEATRAAIEETGAAFARTIEAVAGSAAVGAAAAPASQSMSNPMKGFFEMASSFDPKAFANPDAMKTVFGDVQGRAKDQMEKGAKIVEEMSDFAKGNVEAMMASGRVAAKGTETMAQDAAEFGKKSFEHATQAFKGFAQAKSPTELFKLQSDYARATFDAMVAESSKVTEAWLKLAGEVAQPLSSRVAVAAEKAKAPTAL